jgi:aminoglycoside N3'-acetyltransferase
MRRARNGTDDDLSCMSDRGRDRVFQPETIELDQEDMGAVPAAVLSMQGHIRGNHPLNSFAAVGPLATAGLIRDQNALDVYKPLEMLVSLQGNISMTLLHLAERLAGRTLFRRWGNGPDGRPMMVETGGCSNGVDRFAPLLAPLERQIMVGRSFWRAFPSR